jgi:TetR/AcrR family transcriptional repressor of nem operon
MVGRYDCGRRSAKDPASRAATDHASRLRQFSYADVAEATGIRKANIHHHFPSKADLAIAVVKHSQDMFDADVAALRANGADDVAQLRAYVQHWERCVADDSAPFCVAGMLS